MMDSTLLFVSFVLVADQDKIGPVADTSKLPSSLFSFKNLDSMLREGLAAFNKEDWKKAISPTSENFASDSQFRNGFHITSTLNSVSVLYSPKKNKTNPAKRMDFELFKSVSKLIGERSQTDMFKTERVGMNFVYLCTLAEAPIKKLEKLLSTKCYQAVGNVADKFNLQVSIPTAINGAATLNLRIHPHEDEEGEGERAIAFNANYHHDLDGSDVISEQNVVLSAFETYKADFEGKITELEALL